MGPNHLFRPENDHIWAFLLIPLVSLILTELNGIFLHKIDVLRYILMYVGYNGVRLDFFLLRIEKLYLKRGHFWAILAPAHPIMASIRPNYQETMVNGPILGLIHH